MNEPEPNEEHCVTTFENLENWMEFLILPQEKEFNKLMTITTESPAKNNKKK